MVSKSPFYDILVIIAPGVCLLYLGFSAQIKEIRLLDDTFQSILLFILAYLIGILWNALMEMIFRHLRNDLKGIRKSYDNIRIDYDERTSKLVEKLDNYDLNRYYYNAYYALQRENGLGNVPVLEAHFAFLRNHILIVPFAFCFTRSILLDGSSWGELEKLTCGFVLLLLSILLMLGMYRVMNTRQEKIYSLILEGYYFYRYGEELDSSSRSLENDKVPNGE